MAEAKPATEVEPGTNMPVKPPGDVRRRAPKALPQGPFVKYVGDASHRIIRPPQWRALGVQTKKADATHVWSVANNKMLPVAEFSDEQLDYLLIAATQPRGGHSFLEVDYDKAGNLRQVTS